MLSFALLALLLLAGLVDLANLAAAKRLAGRGYHFVVLQRDGQVFGAGSDSYGQLGLGTASDAVVLPQLMLSVTNSTDISAGSAHSCVLDGGQAKCVGFNYYYQLGDGTAANKRTLVPALGLESGIEEVQCGVFGSCAKTTSGNAQCWGQVFYLIKTSPVTFSVPGGIQSMSLGYGHACFVAAVGGKLYCVGTNYFGKLGTGDTTDQTEPTPVVGLAAEGIVSVACSDFHTCAVNAVGAMFCWGSDIYGQVGNPSITSNSAVPVQVAGITSGAASAWTGAYNSFALMQNGTVQAFGKDLYGLFGTGSKGNQAKPIVFGKGVSGVVEVRGGHPTTCVLLQDDTVWCTGNNEYGQLGVGNTVKSYTLVAMVGIPATHSPTTLPTLAPTGQPTTLQPTLAPTPSTTLVPTKEPTLAPTKQPTLTPTAQPTLMPTTSSPTKRPTTAAPTKRPTTAPTKRPTKAPTAAPTKRPATQAPTKRPTTAPTKRPTKAPTALPTKRPSKTPTKRPTTKAPTKRPTTAKPV